MAFQTNADMFKSVQKPTVEPKAHQLVAVAPTTQATIPEVNLDLSALPSQGKAYPKGSWIKYRAYSFGEVKKVNQEKLSEKDSFEFMLSGVVCSFDKLDITVADALYIGLLRKISTLGATKMVVPFSCRKPDCGSHERPILDTSKLEFDDLAAEDLPVRAEFSFGEYHFQPLTVKRYYYLFDNGKKHTDELYCAAVQVDNREMEEAYKALYAMNADDGSVMNAVDEVLYHGLKAVRFECSKCKTPHEVELDGGQALLIPFREQQQSPKARIHFGLKDKP